MTAQVSEKLIYMGQELNLCSEPLFTYLETIRSELKFVAHSTANWRVGYENRDQEEIINNLLERFQERGEGSFKAGNPKDLDTPWQVVSEFELKPVVNVPGPSAMTVPDGIAPGYLREISSSTVPKSRRFPASCRSVRYLEHTVLEFPRQLHVQRVPKSVNFKSGPLQYQATYSLQGKTLIIKRQYTSNRPSSICDATDDKNWDAISEVMQHDMRNHIFFR